MKCIFGRKSVILLAPLALLIWGCAGPARTVDPGSKWEVAATTKLSQLTIGDGATVSAPAGQTLTMTVDGVQTPLEPGAYKGKVVLTPSEDNTIAYSGMGTKADYKYPAAVVIENGNYVAAKSVPAAVKSGKVSNTEADNIKVTSVGPIFGGVVVTGKSTYTIKNPVFKMTGNGKNDFAGYGATIHVAGDANVTVDGAKIDNTGAVRTAVWAGDNATVTVNNAEIEVHDGVLPKDYGWSWARGGPTGNGDVMMEVPWMLGLKGNNRATLAVGSATVTYNNSHIKAQNWGAMSTDAVTEVLLTLNKCKIEIPGVGYGAYVDGNSMMHSSGSTFDVGTYGLIMSGGSGVFTDASVVNSHKNAVMSHGGNKGTLVIDKGSTLNADEAVIQLKGSTPDILIDNASLSSKKGILLEMFPNDDPNKQGGGAGGGGGAPGGMPGGARAGAPGAGGPPSGGGAPGAAGAAGAPGGAGGGAPGGMGGPGGAAVKNNYGKTNGTNDEFTTIRNSTLKGDFVNALTDKSSMNVKLEQASLTGAVTTATYVHAVGPNGEKLVMQDSTDLYKLIGEVNETYAPTKEAHGATVTLDGASSWTVDKTSYLTGLTIAQGAKVSAPQGSKLTMTVNGVQKPIAAGEYKGKIVLTVAPGA
jgi:hypothetical protein